MRQYLWQRLSIGRYEKTRNMPAVDFQPTTHDRVMELFPETKQSELVFSASTELYLIVDADTCNIVGMCGFRWGASTVTFKNAYIHPKWRNRGYNKVALDKRIEMARERGMRRIDGNLTVPSAREWARRGATIRKRYKNGVILASFYI